MKTLQEQRDELERNLKRKESAHYGKPYWHNEGAYQDSVADIRQTYDQLFKVAQELGDPIPVWF